MTIGWGHTFKHLTNFLNSKNTLGNYRYKNYYPFKSKSGKWYAFWNQGYSDIKIYDLETKQIVIEKFYSSGTGYNPHTNHSVYVPSFIPIKDYVVDDNEFDEWIDDGSLTLDNFEQIQFVPYAFNAWTVWAADYQFYVDIIDLSEIDSGVVKRVKNKGYTIPIDAEHVKNFVKMNTNSLHTMDKKDPVLYSSDFIVLEETYRDRIIYDENLDKPILKNIYDKTVYETENDPPYMKKEI